MSNPCLNFLNNVDVYISFFLDTHVLSYFYHKASSIIGILLQIFKSSLLNILLNFKKSRVKTDVPFSINSTLLKSFDRHCDKERNNGKILSFILSKIIHFWTEHYENVNILLKGKQGQTWRRSKSLKKLFYIIKKEIEGYKGKYIYSHKDINVPFSINPISHDTGSYWPRLPWICLLLPHS